MVELDENVALLRDIGNLHDNRFGVHNTLNLILCSLCKKVSIELLDIIWAWYLFSPLILCIWRNPFLNRSVVLNNFLIFFLWLFNLNHYDGRFRIANDQLECIGIALLAFEIEVISQSNSYFMSASIKSCYLTLVNSYS